MTDILRTLQEASYESIVFPTSKFEVFGGHRIVAHLAHGKDGADLESTGRQPYHGSFTIPCFDNLDPPYGNYFTEHYTDLMLQLSSVPIGSLAHPTHGTFAVGIQNFHLAADPNARNGFWIDVAWTEHNATAQVLVTPPSSTSLGDQAATADAAMAAIGG